MILNSEIDNYQREQNTSFQTMSHKSVRLEVARVSDWKHFQVKCHLGDIFKSGDIFLGFDIEQLNVEELTELKNLPEVVLIRKLRNKENKRIYKLKRMEMEQQEQEKKQGKKQQKGANQEA